MALEILLLGVIEARIDGTPLALGGPRQHRLLGHLALSPGRVRSVDSISCAIWPDGDAPSDHRQAIRTAASRLRTALGGDLVAAHDGGYVLGVGASAVDVATFEGLVREANEPGCPRERTVMLLSTALELWRGNALEGFETEEWARATALRLDELRARARDDRAEALLALGRAPDAVADLEAAAAASPLREHTHGLLMTALHRSGRQAEALRVFQHYRRRLATDLGLEPGAEMRRLENELAADGYDPSSVDGSRPLRGYLLGERIGDGSFAVVYRGTQPSVGRDVAIKVIRAELANRPEFIRRFEFEAHLVARLEHPHIVPLYDYWREPGSAYLVMRLLRGGTLDHRILGHPLSAEDAVRLAEQIGPALAVAHRAGIVHRDVKPANVLLDSEGNFFLGDFGIALEAAAPVTSSDSLSIGSPAYASPEQLRREPVGPTADVHGLAITLYESLTGQLPFPDARTKVELLRRQLDEPLPAVSAVRPDLSSEVDHILGKAAAKDPELRYPSIEEFVDAFAGAVRGKPPLRAGAATAIGELRNPYKGLRAFQEADAVDFHGRQRLVDRLLAKLGGPDSSSRFLTLVGPSGSGKSSVVRAGLIPRLRAGALPGSSQWFVTSMTPGTHPFEELERALNRVAVSPTTGLAHAMAADRRGVARTVKQVCPDEDAQIVVLIDQFEELFTLCSDDMARQQFIAALVDAVADPKSPLRVVATLRADFYDRPLRYPELASLIEDGAVTVSPLAPDELDRAITEPALRVGADFEPGLVARIVADVLDQPGALPLLQYSLTELFDHNVSGLMRLADYEALGGLSGALARRADQVYTASSHSEQEAARRVFTRLVTLGDGTEATRRRVRRSEFTRSSNDAADDAAEAVIDAYGAARLLAFDRDPATREPTVEVAHEALIREWPRLRAWLDDDRDGLRIHRHVTDAARAWQASGREAGELYRGGRLEAAEQWMAGHGDDLNTSESDFMSASLEQREQVRLAERRSRRRIKRALIAVATVAVLALISGVVALQQRRDAVDAKDRANAAATEAETQRRDADDAKDRANAAATEAETQRGLATSERDQARVDRLVAEAAARLDTHLDLSMLLAVEAWRRQPSPSTGGAMLGTLTHQVSADVTSATPAAGSETELATETTVRRSTSRLLGFISVPFESVGRIELSDDGSVAAVSGEDDGGWNVAVFDTAQRRLVKSFPSSTDTSEPPVGGSPSFDFDLSPDGSQLLIIRAADLQILDVASGTRASIAIEADADSPTALDATFTPDSRQFVVRSTNGALSLWDASTRVTVPATLPPRANVGGIAFTRDGHLSYADADPSPALGLWDFAGSRLERRVVLEEPASWPILYALTPDLELLFGSMGSVDPVIAWDAQTGELLPALPTPGARALVIDPIDPSLLVLGTGSGQLVTYDQNTGRVIGKPLGAGLRDIATAVDAKMMATVSDDRVIALWGDNAGPGLIDTPVAPGMTRPVYGGGLVAMVSDDGHSAEIRTADAPATPGVPIAKTVGTSHIYTTVQPSADGSAVLAQTLDFAGGPPAWSLTVADPTTGAARWSFYDPAWTPLPWSSINGDGTLVAAASERDIRIFDVTTNLERARIDAPSLVQGPAVFSADGRYFYVTTDHGPLRYDLANPDNFVSVVEPTLSWGRVAPIAGTPDIVAMAGIGKGLARWNMDTGAKVEDIASLDGSDVGDVIASPDGRWVSGFHFHSGNIALFDATTLEPVGLIPAAGSPIWAPDFTPDGDLSFDSVTGQATVWDLDPQHWADAACHAAGRNLTQAEWERYVGTDEPYRATCAEWPDPA